MPMPATTASADNGLAAVGLDREAVAIFFHGADLLAGQHVDAFVAEIGVEEFGELRRINARANAAVGKDHGDLQPFMASAAAISEPMKPPPMTMNSALRSASARRRW